MSARKHACAHRHGGHGKPIVPVDEVGPRLYVGFRVVDLLILEPRALLLLCTQNKTVQVRARG